MSERVNLFKRFVPLALGAFLLTACSEAVPSYDPRDVTSKQMSKGFIADGVHVRKSPQRVEDIDSDNSCTTLGAAVVLKAGTVSMADSIGTNANGQWVGFTRAQLPEVSDCGDTYGDMVWVAKKFVDADFSNATVTALTK